MSFEEIITLAFTKECALGVSSNCILHECADQDLSIFSVNRKPYFVRGAKRPILRGLIMKKLLYFWPVFVFAHWLFCFISLEDRDVKRIIYRTLVGLSTSLNVLTSDRYHNGDSHQHKCDSEYAWLKIDLLSISFILSTTFALWSSHFREFNLLVVFDFALSGLCALNIYSRQCIETFTSSEIWNKLIFGVQYFILLFYLIMAMPDTCGPVYGWYALIWWAYLPGILCFALHWPSDGKYFGGHDILHLFVIIGHGWSMVGDAINIHVECAEQ